MSITSTRRLFLQGTAVTGVAAALAACSQQSSEEQASDASSKAAEEATQLPSTDWDTMDYADVPEGGTLTVSIGQLPDNWNYNQANGLLADLSTIRESQTGGLLADEGGESKIDPNYLVSAELKSEDPEVVAVKYNPDAVWEDGSPIVIDDLIAFWKALKGDNDDYQVGSTIGWQDIADIKQTDDEYTGEITYANKFADWITLLTPDIPASISNDATAFNEGYLKTPTPSYGPFRVGEFDENAGVVTLVHNEKWWGQAPKLEKIIYRVVDQSQAPSSFANSEIDVVDIADGDTYATAKKRSDAEIKTTNGLTWTHVTINTTHGALKDPEVRKAVAYAINRDAIGQAVVGPLEAPVVLVNNAVFMPGQEGYEDSYGGELKYDTATATKILEDAGYAKDGDVYAKDGEKLEFAITVPADTKSNNDRAIQIQKDLNSAGFKIEIKTVPSDQYFDEYISKKDYDFVTFSWVGTAFPIQSMANLFYPVDSQQNYTGFANDKIKDVDAKTQAEFDPDKRRADANEFSKIALGDYTIIPFYATPKIWGIKQGLVNYGPAQFQTIDYTAIGWKE